MTFVVHKSEQTIRDFIFEWMHFHLKQQKHRMINENCIIFEHKYAACTCNERQRGEMGLLLQL